MPAPETRSRTVSPSVTSPETTSTWARTSGLSESSQPQVPSELYCAIARTRCPRVTRCSTRCEPMNPSAPVTATVVVTVLVLLDDQ